MSDLWRPGLLASVAPELTIEAFHEVPLPFWRTLSPKGMHNLMTECDGRLTLPEREYLWKLLERPGEPPRRIRVVFDEATLKRLFPADRTDLPASPLAAAEQILGFLQRGAELPS